MIRPSGRAFDFDKARRRHIPERDKISVPETPGGATYPPVLGFEEAADLAFPFNASAHGSLGR
jgi:hypothetical protein